ncbi:hypothetical protein Taro_035629, partial [Colocasia esculenta]|nr:hypothetical protein [Colocasia esculenta]
CRHTPYWCRHSASNTRLMQNWSSSVDTSSGSVDTVLQIQGKKVSGSVDTRDSSQKTFWPIWDSCVDTSSSSVDTSALPEQNLIGHVEPENTSHAVVYLPRL